MKKSIISFALIIFSCSLFAQVAIGKGEISSASVSLEFGNGNRGMVLPWVTASLDVVGAVNGTMIYDLTDKKVKVKYNTEWKDLSVVNNGTVVDPISFIDGVALQDLPSENSSAKVAIGTLTSTPGILVLEDSDKAMILPVVASPHLNIVNPSPGMMVYDSFNKQLAVFNGAVWSFWKN